MKTIIVCIAMSLFAWTAIHAQTDSEKRLKADIQFLSDDLLKGRATPGEELDIAALYLANQLEAYGWKPANASSYLQNVPVVTFDPLKSKYKVVLNGYELKPEEYVLIPQGLKLDNITESHDLVFLGQGIFAPEKNIDDFQNINIEGKAGIAFFGAPWTMNPHEMHGCDHLIGKAVQVGVRKGSLLVYVTDEFENPARNNISMEIPMVKTFHLLPKTRLADSNNKAIEYSAFLIISKSTFDRTLAGITGKNYDQWQKRLYEKKRMKSFPLKSKIDITINAPKIYGTGHNVVATRESKDPQYGHEWIVLTAHYDHLGIKRNAEGKDSIYNGADDNASGTAAVMEIARKLSETPNLRRSIMVFFCCGEESGLLGSAFFTFHPVVPMDKIVLDVNVDMVGRYGDHIECIDNGCEELYQQAKKLEGRFDLKVLPEQNPHLRLAYFTDSYSFSRFDTPSIEFTTGFHPDYHQPSDEARLINYNALDKITKLIYDFAVYYANGAEKPVFKRPAWFQTSGH